MPEDVVSRSRNEAIFLPNNPVVLPLIHHLPADAANIYNADVAALTGGAADPANFTVGTVIADGRGSVSNLRLFGKGLFYINAGGSFELHVGAGMVSSPSATSRWSSGSVTAATDPYQLMAEASFDVSERFPIFVQYAFLSKHQPSRDRP